MNIHLFSLYNDSVNSEDLDKMVVRKQYPEEKELEEIEQKLNKFYTLLKQPNCLICAKDLKLIKDLKKQRERLKENLNYYEWFNNNEDEIVNFNRIIAKDLLEEKIIEIIIEKNGILYDSKEFKLYPFENLKEFLRRYGYCTIDTKHKDIKIITI